jgi:hypothetical protein
MRTSGMGCGGGGRGYGPFYRAGEAGRRLVGRETDGGLWSFTPSVFKAEMRGGKVGGVVLVGETKKVGCWFGSATHTWRRAADGSAGRGDSGSGETEEEEGPGGPVMGRKAKTSWAGEKIFQGEWFGLQI